MMRKYGRCWILQTRFFTSFRMTFPLRSGWHFLCHPERSEGSWHGTLPCHPERSEGSWHGTLHCHPERSEGSQL